MILLSRRRQATFARERQQAEHQGLTRWLGRRCSEGLPGGSRGLILLKQGLFTSRASGVPMVTVSDREPIARAVTADPRPAVDCSTSTMARAATR